jgi:cytochrome d ubiquinol oxidase subunit I
MAPSGIVATLGGWYLAETGRQPWVIWGILKTADAVSLVPPNVLLSTLIAFVCVYALFMTAFLVYAAHVVRRGPKQAPEHAEPTGSLKPALTVAVMQAEPAE